jgi:outer membrane immunogenic protein
MKKSLISATAIALALSAGAALAADLPSRKEAPVYVPPPPPPLWTGFYVGLNAGGTFGGDNSVNVVTGPIYNNPSAGIAANSLATALTGAAGATGILSSGGNGGFIGGGQVGYNYQFQNNFLVGIEADIQGIAGNSSSGLNGSSAVQLVAPAPAGNYAITSMAATKSIDYLGTVRGRLGYLVTPTLLIYGTGGLAYGGGNSSTSIFQTLSGPWTATINGPYASSGSYSDTLVGWTAGGGLEWLFLPNWSAKVEYLYYDLGSLTYSNGTLANIVIPPGGVVPTGGLWHALASQSSTHFNGNIVRVGVNYHFNWGAPAPVIAKY